MEINIFDIETKPYSDLEILKNAKPFDRTSVKMGNIKDPDKQEAKLEAAEIAHKRRYLDNAALDPHFSSICAIGLNKAQSREVQALCGVAEEEILEMFWAYYRSSHDAWAYWSGSNNKECFDPRHIIVRSWKLGVLIPHGVISTRGYLTDRFVDLSQVYMFGDSYPSFCSSENACKQLGLTGSDSGCGIVLSKDYLKGEGVEGKNFYKVLEDDRKLALKYLTNDVAMERAIANRIL